MKEEPFEKSDEFDDTLDEFHESEEEKPVVDRKIQFDIGTKEADVYTEEGREELEDSDEIDPWEEGFSEGEVSEKDPWNNSFPEDQYTVKEADPKKSKILDKDLEEKEN